MIRRRSWKIRLTLVAISAAAAACLLAVPLAQAATFDREDVISDDSFRAASSMTAADVQAFLDGMTGILTTYTAPDYSGVRKSAAVIVADAAKAWNVSPKVILSTLQKEQSLLTLKSPTNKALTEAMGCGIYPGSTNRYPGFGSQVWNGARKLSTYEQTYSWYAGKTMNIGGTTITPANAATFAQYTYTPSFSGVNLFWTVYSRYFGDPHAPARLRPMYRFYNSRTGAYFFTTSEGERYRVLSKTPALKYQAVAFTIDSSSTANTVPLYRLYNKTAGRYFYSAKIGEVNAVLRTRVGRARVWHVDKIMEKVSLDYRAGPAVWRLYAKRTNSYIYTASASERNRLVRSGSWRYQGAAWYLGR